MISSVKAKKKPGMGSAMRPDVKDKFPYLLEEQGFDIWHLGPPDRALFLCDLVDPIVLTAVSAEYRYRLPFDMTMHKFVWYQVDAAGAEADDALNVRFDMLHPNRTPENIYNKQGVSWEAGGSRNTGRTFMPAGEMVLTVDGVATNLLYFSVELEVWKSV